MNDPDDPLLGRWARAEIDLDALAHNVGVLRRAASPAEVWAVVKADGYGHGALDVARTALDAGAAGLCVALVAEGVVLRRAGVDAPILVLSPQPAASAPASIEADLIATVGRVDDVEALADAARAAGRTGVEVHVKVDTGMQRVGAAPDRTPTVVRAVVEAAPHLRLAGMFTHLAVADEPEHPMNAVQLDRFDDVVARVRDDSGAEVIDAIVRHAANSAGALAHPRARYDLVRAGIALYGISPGPGVDDLAAGLRPAMRLTSRVSLVKPVRAGTAVSYGLRHVFQRDTSLATVPIGYADGVPRRLSAVGGTVSVRGERRPIVGVVTMDQLMVDVGDLDVEVGDEVVLLGAPSPSAGDATAPDPSAVIRAEEWAGLLDTIGYEIVCGVGSRVPRVRRPRLDG